MTGGRGNGVESELQVGGVVGWSQNYRWEG